MAIRISLGNIGSGKTASEVREMYTNPHKRLTYSNIIMKRPELTPHVKLLTMDKIIKKEIVDVKRNKRTGEETPVYEQKMNVEFWKGHDEPLNVVLDEAHSIINSRRSASKVNLIMGDFIALLRRVLGSVVSGQGELVLITQLPFRIDKIAREMAHEIRYHICQWNIRCNQCSYVWVENSEQPMHSGNCYACNSSNLNNFDYKIYVFCFDSFDNYWKWKDLGIDSTFRSYVINDIHSTAFGLYDSLQWEHMFSEEY